ncbi:MAG: ATP-binding protein [Proteobacteria bacterium]|nr:ATP-binding protein [Pseudomonadota bacterium]
MKRSLFPYIQKDLDKKIVLLAGPRQVGKTTLSKTLIKDFEYFNYDASADRKIVNAAQWRKDTDLVILDEVHKMRKWKSWIKGIYDTAGIPPRLLLTGSARLDTFRKAGDSLAGRHFYYRLHPFTLKELKGQMDAEVTLKQLLKFGGFPEPFLSNSERTAARWRKGHLDVILRQDVLDLERVREIRSIEILIELLAERVGSLVSYQSLAEDIGTSIHTIKHWLEILQRLFVIFQVSPFSKNIAGALKKESKYYFYDVGQVLNGDAARLENVVACALLAELNFIEDTEGKKTALHLIRDKQKHEVDFVVIVDKRPRLLVEVKMVDEAFSSSLFRFAERLGEKDLKSCQVVLECSREKESQGVRLLSVAKFLNNIQL